MTTLHLLNGGTYHLEKSKWWERGKMFLLSEINALHNIRQQITQEKSRAVEISWSQIQRIAGKSLFQINFEGFLKLVRGLVPTIREKILQNYFERNEKEILINLEKLNDALRQRAGVCGVAGGFAAFVIGALGAAKGGDPAFIPTRMESWANTGDEVCSAIFGGHGGNPSFPPNHYSGYEEEKITPSRPRFILRFWWSLGWLLFIIVKKANLIRLAFLSTQNTFVL